MEEPGTIFLGAGGGGPQRLLLNKGNRHGLIAGATGTGKTVTLQGLAEGFSAAGVPVFMADVKGDLAGMAMPGSPNSPIHQKLVDRAKEIGLTDYSYADNPVVFWDLYGEQGHPIRTTVSEMGPLLLARLMGLNETQEGVLSIAFRLADEQGLLLLNLDDLQAMLVYCAEQAATLTAQYGNVTRATVGTIQRQLLQLESQGGGNFFGEPALAIADFMTVDENGRGTVNILAADKLMQSPRLYAHVPALAALGVVRGAAGGRRSRKAEAGLLLRRGASALRRRAERAAGEGRAGRPPGPLQGRRHLFHHPEPDRHSRGGRRPARQSRPARLARLHAQGRARDPRRGRHLPAQSRRRCRDRDHRAEDRRGSGLACSTTRARRPRSSAP